MPEVHGETPHAGNALGAVAAALWHRASPRMGTIQTSLESVGVGGCRGGRWQYCLLRLWGSQSSLERNELKVRQFGAEREKHPSKFT